MNTTKPTQKSINNLFQQHHIILQEINNNGFFVNKCFGIQTIIHMNNDYNKNLPMKPDEPLFNCNKVIEYKKEKYIYIQIYLMGCCDEKTSQDFIVKECICKFTREDFMWCVDNNPLFDFDGSKISNLFKSDNLFWNVFKESIYNVDESKNYEEEDIDKIEWFLITCVKKNQRTKYIKVIKQLLICGDKYLKDDYKYINRFLKTYMDFLKPYTRNTDKQILEKTQPNENQCCICDDKFTGYGNNPSPIKDEGVCCDKCNILVITRRLQD